MSSQDASRADPPTPDPLQEKPPADRFCDIILNGGVASGVVYPWAILELARRYRFRRIGGNSVGAMAAALAAAAEYGRCNGNPHAFEVLRQAPLDLAQVEDGRTLMQRLFQPSAGVKRLFDCLLVAIHHLNRSKPVRWAALLTVRDILGRFHLDLVWLIGALLLLGPSLLASGQPMQWGSVVVLLTGGLAVAEARASDERRGRVLVALLAAVVLAHVAAAWLTGLASLLAFLGWPVLLLGLSLLLQLRPDLRAFRDNGYGLCTGRAQPGADGKIGEKALLEWLHEGIQRSAGRQRHDPPLTFADLWNAPRFGSAAVPGSESIGLEMFSSNITLGRPVSWPLQDRHARLFFEPAEWQAIFPPTLLDAVVRASVPYAPARGSRSDPPADRVPSTLREIPAGGLPIAVAARLSLSFPFLFTFVPVYAIDYEMERSQRVPRRCLLTDGGLCTNFPIHLFDAAHPRWPTFGMMLSRRIATHKTQSVWLPEQHLEGSADNWSRGVPGAQSNGAAPRPLKGLVGLVIGMLGTALDWNDNVISRLPHVRNRVLRMALQPGEGQLNILMSRSTILHMAHDYGTRGGRKLVGRFVSDSGVATRAWREHLYVRGMNQLQALRQHLRGYGAAVRAGGHGRPLAALLADAVGARPLHPKSDGFGDASGAPLSPAQQAALQEAVEAVAALERALDKAAPDAGPYQPEPPTRLHLRSRL